MTNSNSISILPHPPVYVELGLYFVCGTCASCTFVTIRQGEDGIELSDSIGNFSPLKSSQHKVCLVRTPQGKLLISCAYCRSGKTMLEVLPSNDGISCSPASSERRVGEHNETKRGIGVFYTKGGQAKWRVDRRKTTTNLKERLDFFNHGISQKS